jgi:hypothetical protein
MSVTVVKEGGTLKVLQASDVVPDGTKLTLYTVEELSSIGEERRQWLNAQMPSFVRGDENETAEELF